MFLLYEKSKDDAIFVGKKKKKYTTKTKLISGITLAKNKAASNNGGDIESRFHQGTQWEAASNPSAFLGEGGTRKLRDSKASWRETKYLHS